MRVDIFNDVIGPVMRGPSSSHTAASWRIARTALDILNDDLEKALIEFDRDGAWAPNYREQGTTMGIDAGLLGLDVTDERMKETEIYALQKGVDIEYRISSFPTSHSNSVRITLWGNSKKSIQLVAVSKGGGSFEIQNINGVEVMLAGDTYGLIVRAEGVLDNIQKPDLYGSDLLDCRTGKMGKLNLFVCTFSEPIAEDTISLLRSHPEIESIAMINPVMPVIAGKQKEVPFTSVASLIEYAENEDKSLGEMGIIYETCTSGLTENEIARKMTEVIQVINESIDIGMKGTVYDDRILPQQSHLIEKAEKRGIIKKSIFNRIVAYVSALMESKSAMEVVVAVPTAGSCGTVGGLVRACAEDYGAGKDELIKAYFAAGLIGVYFADGPGFSAEEHGCQVECGAASGMAAAAVVQLMGGTARQAVDAASMAIQNMIGLVCDPVADRVEVPCLGKNISAAVNAYSSAIMAISGYNAIIPLDEVIQTVLSVSKSMPSCVKCTGKGGLAITNTAESLKQKLIRK